MSGFPASNFTSMDALECDDECDTAAAEAQGGSDSMASSQPCPQLGPPRKV